MKLPIVRYGDPVLRAKGKRIEQVDARLRELAANMIETMHEANGVGLAAQQVGLALQLTVIDVAGAEDQTSTLEAERRRGGPERRRCRWSCSIPSWRWVKKRTWRWKAA